MLDIRIASGHSSEGCGSHRAKRPFGAAPALLRIAVGGIALGLLRRGGRPATAPPRAWRARSALPGTGSGTDTSPCSATGYSSGSPPAVTRARARPRLPIGDRTARASSAWCRSGRSPPRGPRPPARRRSAGSRRRAAGTRRGCPRPRSARAGESPGRAPRRRRRRAPAERPTSTVVPLPPGPELTPSVPAASASVTEANRQIAPARRGRRAGSTGRSSSAPPPARSATGASTRALPSDPAERHRQPVARTPAVPAAVQHKSHEHPDRHEPETEHVALALIQHRQAREARGTWNPNAHAIPRAPPSATWSGARQEPSVVERGSACSRTLACSGHPRATSTPTPRNLLRGLTIALAPTAT